MGLDTFTLLSRDEVKDMLRVNCGGKVKWIGLSATILILLLVLVTFSLAMIKLGASTKCIDATHFRLSSYFHVMIYLDFNEIHS